MARRASAARVKANMAYTVEEASEVVGVTEQTIRAWLRQGLNCLAAKRPALIMGYELRDFLKRKDKAKRQPLAFGEVFCLSCKAPTTPAGDMIEYAPLTERRGRLMVLCGTCGGMCVRLVGASELPRWAVAFDLSANSDREA
jgi:predicted transcriptional regulator